MKTNGRIIVSFTTSPSRINHIKPVIECICNQQTIRPDILILYLPERFARTEEEYTIPANILALEQSTNFQIRRIDEDKGPITKVIYALMEYNEPDDIIISIDDDVIYHKQFIEEFLDAHRARPKAVLSFIGCDPPSRPFIHAEHIQNGVPDRVFINVRAIGGYRGILYPRNCIHQSFFEHLDALNTIHLQTIKKPLLEDDNYISYYCRLVGIPVLVIGTFYPGNMSSPNLLQQLNFKFLDSSNINGLYSSNNNSNMKASYKILEEFYNKLGVQ
jgi:hypothetical protein